MQAVADSLRPFTSGGVKLWYHPAAEIARFAKTVRALRIDIEKITGKESVELMRQRGE